MSVGKAAAQAAHASQMGLRGNAKPPHGNPYDASIVNRWMLAGHYAKVVLESDDLEVARLYLHERGFDCAAIIDEGRTEFSTALTLTALGLPVLDKDSAHVRETFKAFKLYKDPPRQVVIIDQVITSENIKIVQECLTAGADAAEINTMLQAQKKKRWWGRNL